MIYYGFDEVLYGWNRYYDLCNAFEMRHTHKGEDAPTLATLNRWRVESPKGFAWVMHADPSFLEALVEAYEQNERGLTDAIRAGWQKTEALAHALAAKAIALETPPEFPPSDASRALIRAIGDELAGPSKRALIWEASGLWTPEDVVEIALEAGLTPTVDPFMFESEGTPLPASRDIVFRVTERAAARRQFDRWDMERLVQWCEPYQRAFVLFGGRFKVAHAKELSLLLRKDDTSPSP